MQYSTLPHVRDGTLHFTSSAAGEQASVLVGSAQWHDLLEQLDAFGFEDQSGCSFTARRERRQQQWYWYAYRKRGTKLHKIYLGKAEQLEQARLQAAARDLANLPRQAESNASSDPHSQARASQLSAEQARDLFLHSAKLRVPAPPATLIPRPRLTQQLRRPLRGIPAAVNPSQHRSQMLLTLITAPVGYGKSTLLSEWLHPVGDMHVAWLSLEPAENDLRQFWCFLVAALQTSVPELGRQALLLLQEQQPCTIDRVLTTLLDDLHHIPHALVLVLDEYHVIDTPAIHDTLATFLMHCPSHLHVVISSQTRPPLPLGRLRLRCDVIELQTAELRLTDEEGVALLSREPQLAGNEQAITTVLHKTEGWLAGVHLFVLALQNTSDLETALAEVDGSHRYLTEFFCDNVLRQQSPLVQTFLLHTAILDHLSGSLCEAVTELPNGQQQLAQLEQANLFLTALDRRSGKYCYHPLFAQALRHTLEQMHPANIPVLHRRAAQWYLERQAIADALHHLVAGQCWKEAADVLEQHALPMLQRGNVRCLLHGLGQLPQEVLGEHPTLLVIRGHALLLAGELNALDAWLEHLRSSNTSQSGVEAAANIRALIATNTYVAENTAWESLDAFTRSMQYWSQDDTEASYVAAAQAVQHGQASGFRSVSLLAAGTLSMLHIIHGELHTALRVAHEGLALGHTTEAAVLSGAREPNPATGALVLALGLIAYERNRLHLAQQCLEQALALTVELGREDYLFAAHAFLARTLAAQGQGQQALALMEVGVERARTGRIALWSHADLLAYQAWTWLHCGELALAAEWAQTADVRIDDPHIFQRRIEYWVYGELLLAQGQYEHAVHILGRLVQSATGIGARTEPLVKLLVAYASALFGLGERTAALPVLERALELGQPEGSIRSFLDHAPHQTRALLAYYQQKNRPLAHIEAYVQQLLAASKSVPLRTVEGADGTTPPMMLSRREREILRLVEAGLSNTEIARKLVIETNTVKSHLHRIYQRLSVNTRYHAVKHAKTLQLL